MFTGILLSVVFIILIYCVWPKSRAERLVDTFLGPPKLPISGNLHQGHYGRKELFAQIRYYSNLYLETFRVWMGPYAVINILTPEDAEAILSSIKHIDKSIFYKFMGPWLGTGLLTSTGRKWQTRRKILTPAFHFSILKRFVPIFGEHSASFASVLKKECTKGKVNVVPLVTKSTLNVICETAMGNYLQSKETKQERYYETIHRVCSAVVQRSMKPWIWHDGIYFNIPWGRKHLRDVNVVHEFTNEVIRDRERHFVQSDVENLEDSDSGTGKKRLAMLDLLLSQKLKYGTIDDEGIREEVDTFTFEGHDTTAMALCYALMTIACHEEHQNKIVDELRDIFGSSERLPTYEDLQNMKYLELCIKECLRLFPSVPLISRVLTEDCQLTKSIAPAGTIINIFIYNLHRNPNVFPNPDVFDPDRFLPENCQGRHPYAYIPFSAGPRNCIGQKFAMMEIKSTLSTILRNFQMIAVSKEKDLKILMDLVLRNSEEIYVKFVPRSI